MTFERMAEPSSTPPRWSPLGGRSPGLSVLALALVTVPIALLTFGSNQACTEAKVVTSDPPIVIGATVDLTKQKDFGAGSQRVLRVAEQQLNAVGGVLGRRVVLDIRDDGGDGALIGGLSADFIERGVVGFVGPSTTDALKGMHGAFRDARIPILTPFATSPEVPLLQEGKDRYLFRTSCAVEYQARAIARYALGGSFAPPEIADPPNESPKDAGDADGGEEPAPVADAGTGAPFKACRKMAVLYAEDAPGKGSATIESLREEYSKFGGVLKDFVIQAGAATYAAEAAEVVAAAEAGEVECQTLLMFAADGGKYMREFRGATQGNGAFSAASFSTFGFIRFYQQGFIEAGRVDAKNTNELSKVDGVLGAACNQERNTSPEWARFDALYRSQFPPAADDAGSLPSPIPQIYDSVILLALAVEKAGSVDDRVAIRDALYSVSAPPGDAFGPGQLAEALNAVRSGRDIDYTGASGTFDIDDRGDTALEVILWRVSGNGFVSIPDLRSGDLQK
ncbi:MAG: ABC transporter substrate-binding protein [Labilithrix sp.]|nr:ABC transporter substrate-binding protein [Labilithrix sp.]MCW5832492.1 ABC transporter substrate-binding protein [Labilithrix sp.]